MRDVLPQLIDRVREGPVALARVVAVTGAGPREIGAAMVVTGSGEVIGSLSGGCVESAVVESAAAVLADGEAVLERFGIVDPDGVAIGLTCGGEMEIQIERIDSSRLAELEILDREIRAGRSVSLVTTLDGQPRWQIVRPGAGPDARAVDAEGGSAAQRGGRLGRSAVVSRDALTMARAGRTGTIGSDECADSAFPARSFVQSFGSPARMILAGANDFVRALSRLGAQLGYRVTVVDARETFATALRFPAAHEVVVDWPHRYLRAEHAGGRVDNRTVVCVLTHDSKFDVPMLAEALSIEKIGFVGAMGSRRTHAERLERLVAAGVGSEQLRRLRSPLGLDLNASTPDETAVSIAAQVIAEAGRGSGRPLEETDGPIHH
ncbi:XdhC family protein [Nocardia sp. NBC_01503]|uniref:XdhC family protein n=1 Tax=Nocardia sp. NBC_01503 TaxID=2975997 RepID=UPI002E7B3964|nr:XdhC family protein [Nocardia sp. NBC_01503]WTL29730.1 XdhC family protein [Nocardia sp. NBC_01503]